MQRDARHRKQASCSCCAPRHKGCSGSTRARGTTLHVLRLADASNRIRSQCQHQRAPVAGGQPATGQRLKRGRPSRRARPGIKVRETAGARGGRAAGPGDRKDNRVGAERGDVAEAQKPAAAQTQREDKGPGPGISDEREREDRPQREAGKTRPRGAWPG